MLNDHPVRDDTGAVGFPRLDEIRSALHGRLRALLRRDPAPPKRKGSRKTLRRERRAAQRAAGKTQRQLERQLDRVKAMNTELKSARKAQARAERALQKKSAALETLKREVKGARRELAAAHRLTYESSTRGIPGWSERWHERPGRRVLYIGRRDYAGSMIEWARAVNLHTDYAVRLATLERHPFGYDADLIVKAPSIDVPTLSGRDGAGLAALVAEADVIHIKEETIGLPSSGLRASWFLETGKPVIFTCNGSHTRRSIADPELRAELVDHLRGYAACVAMTPDLLHPEVNATFVPHSVDCTRVGFSWSDRSTIAHSPSSITSKGTALIVAAMADVRRDIQVELDLIRNVSNAECVARKAHAGIFFDQAGAKFAQMVGWYGHAALEAAIAGVPTVAHLGEHALAQLSRIDHPMAEDLEIINVQPSADDLAAVLLEFFRVGPEERLAKAMATRAWVERHHDYSVVAHKLARLYDRALA